MRHLSTIVGIRQTLIARSMVSGEGIQTNELTLGLERRSAGVRAFQELNHVVGGNG
jgi:hypothetical protein